MARHKPAAQGGYQRGEDTRARIVEAAVRVFGEKGYAAASTRDIASAAGVNAPALQYYFEGKEGVYLACLEQLIEHLWQQMGSTLELAEAALVDAQAEDGRLIDLVLNILDAVISMLEDTPEHLGWRGFLDCQHAGLGPDSAKALFETRFKSRLASVIRGLIARLTGFPPGDERTVIHTMALFSQGLAFRAQRSTLLRALGWPGIGAREMGLLKEVVLAQARFSLEGLVGQKTERDRLPSGAERGVSGGRGDA